MNCIQHFYEIYHQDPMDIAFCPYRICPLGAHCDHQLGKITGFAIDRGIHIAYKPKQNGVVELASLDFEKRAQFHVNATPEPKQDDWADYLRGATIALSKRYRLKIGMAGVIEGSLPIGGLSSSAAVTIAFLSALCIVNGIELTPQEMIQFALEAENLYVGVSCGKLDQSCEVYAKRRHLLYLDTRDDSYELLPQPATLKPFHIVIVFSGLERMLAASRYNMRVDECRAAAYALQAYAEMDYGKFREANLRNVPREVFESYKNQLPPSWRRRAQHWYDETDRVERGIAAWQAGNLDTFGRLVFESGRSSIDQWETGSPELKKLYEIMTVTEGIYGGRFSGAGFKGCSMALVNPEAETDVCEKITRDYLQAFPHLKDKFSVHVCESENGVCLRIPPRR